MTINLVAQYITIAFIITFTFLVSFDSTKLIFFTNSTEDRISTMKVLAFDMSLFLLSGFFYMHLAGA